MRAVTPSKPTAISVYHCKPGYKWKEIKWEELCLLFQGAAEEARPYKSTAVNDNFSDFWSSLLNRLSGEKAQQKNLFHSARWSQQRRANLADKHELVVAECPLCDFNALSQWMEGKSLLWQRAEQTREERPFQTRCAITSVALRCLRTSPDRFDFVLWVFVAVALFFAVVVVMFQSKFAEKMLLSSAALRILVSAGQFYKLYNAIRAGGSITD